MKALSVLVLLATFFYGCATSIRTTKGPEASLLVGYIDVSDAPGTLDSVYVIQDEKSGIAYRNGKVTSFKNGLFFIENIPPMRYNLSWFMLGGKRHMVTTSEEGLITVKPGTIHYLGAFKYKTGKRNLAQAVGFESEKYHLAPVKGQMKKVMRMLHPHLKDPRWKKRVAKLK